MPRCTISLLQATCVIDCARLIWHRAQLNYFAPWLNLLASDPFWNQAWAWDLWRLIVHELSIFLLNHIFPGIICQYVINRQNTKCGPVLNLAGYIYIYKLKFHAFLGADSKSQAWLKYSESEIHVFIFKLQTKHELLANRLLLQQHCSRRMDHLPSQHIILKEINSPSAHPSYHHFSGGQRYIVALSKLRLIIRLGAFRGHSYQMIISYILPTWKRIT